MTSKSRRWWIPAALAAILAAPAIFGQETPAAKPAPAEATAAEVPGCKVGFVNLARVLDESKEGKNLKASLESEKDKAFAPLKARQAELEQLEQQISALSQEIIQKGQVWDPYTRNSKQIELQNVQMRYNNILNQLNNEKMKIQDDLNKKKNDMLKPLEDELNEVMEKIGSEGGYCLVMDVSPPNPNFPNFNPIIYRDPALDITDEVIAAVDK